MSPNHLPFPKGFYFGSATAAYQIEGAVNEDGREDSIWDTFSHKKGNITTGENGDIACDHYHRYKDDIGLMKTLGLNAYRFSISWPRVFPKGSGQLNQKGVDFYNRLVDGLLQSHIQPFATLYHWDLPQALQNRGGWENRDTVYYFRDYAGEMSHLLGDRVKHWITHNEPQVASFLGNYFGGHAPGNKNLKVALQVAHNLLLSHGEAVPAIRMNGDISTQVGITLNMGVITGASTKSEDIAAAKRLDEGINLWFLDPLTKGQYPPDLVKFFGKDFPLIDENDFHIIQSPIDFLGLNYYTRLIAKHDPHSINLQATDTKSPDSEYTEMGWEVYPEGIYELLHRLHHDYHLQSLYITENGAAFNDILTSDSKINDTRRINYIEKHFEQAHRAIQSGIPLKGYFVWSLLDNFEWALGTSKRFGIVYIDYPTQKRIIKQSGHWYRDFIQQNKSS